LKSLFHGHRFPGAVISCSARWYFRFQLSLRDTEELLCERGVIATYETIRWRCDKCGKGFPRRVKAARCKPGSTWYLDEMVITRGDLLRASPYCKQRFVAWCELLNSPKIYHLLSEQELTGRRAPNSP